MAERKSEDFGKEDRVIKEKNFQTTKEGKIKQQQIEELERWVPRTRLGKLVKNGKVKELDEALKYKILEPEIVESLTNLKSEILNIGQAKGKFGGGKRRAWRQTQKKTAEGNIPTFSCMSVIGNQEGYVGLGYGKAQETLPARAKALRKAKLNIAKIKRGCGSFDCICGEPHTVPFVVEGKSGSCKIKLIPAPQGTGLVIGDELKKILEVAGIKDVYSVTTGKIRTTFNLAKACIDALHKTMKM